MTDPRTPPIKIEPIDATAPAHPLAQFAGMFKDDPLIEEWKRSMKAHRRKVDKDANRP